MRNHPIYQLTLVKIREFVREPEALFWTFAFPILMAVVLAVAFRSQPESPAAIGVVDEADASWIVEALDEAPGIDVELLAEDAAHQKLRDGRLAMVVVPATPWVYWFDPTRPESRTARLRVNRVLQVAAGREPDRPTGTREMTEKGSRYIDFLIAGLIGLGLLGTGIWGVSFYIVTSRMNQLLKRLVAAPMRKSHFLLAQILGRLAFLVPEVGLLLAFAYWVLDVPMRGSLVSFAFVTVLGAVAFSGFGLLVGSRAKTIEGVSGLMNLVMVPSWILSGVFFSTERFPDAMQPAIQLLPLTATIDALRSIMLEGATLVAVSGEIAIVTAWAFVTFAVALAIFRWT